MKRATRWQTLENVFHQAMAVPEAERAAFLEKACGADHEMRREVDRLIKGGTNSDFIQESLGQQASALIDSESSITLIGKCIGNYEIRSLLGAGGMGEVYEAIDRRLSRSVAIKVLPTIFANDSSRLVRFRREAQLLASLNQANVAAVHDFEEWNGIHYLVMELVPGETLAARISQGPLNTANAVEFAIRIAEALEAAHSKGIIHRDLKPSNIKVTPRRNIKVLDFGIAKALDSDSVPLPPEDRTMQGQILGTPAYMSPEQVKGKPIDLRTDIWSFGCVLYEMLTGTPAFVGETPSEKLARVLEGEPDWSLIPKETPVLIKALVQRCLQKEITRRQQHIEDARVELEEALRLLTHDVPFADSRPMSKHRSIRGVFLGLVLLLGIAIVSAINLQPQRDMAIPVKPTRTIISLLEGQQLEMDGQALALSPDGTLFAYVAQRGGTTQLYVRPMNQFEARPLPDTVGARYPFFSSDGRWVGFFVITNGGTKLYKAPVTGGAPVEICTVPESLGRGGTWAGEAVVFSAGVPPVLWSVPEAGGIPDQLTRPSSTPHLWPQFLPDGDHVVFSGGLDGTGGGGDGLAVVSIKTRQARRITSIPGKQARFVRTGHLMFAQGGAIRAVPFDLKRLQVTGAAVPVLDPVFDAWAGGGSFFAVADDLSLVYVPGGSEYSLVWVDRVGRVSKISSAPRGYRRPALSPDERYIGVTIDPADQSSSSIWISDLLRGTERKLVLRGHALGTAWSPDGTKLVFGLTGKDSGADIYQQSFDTSSPAELLLKRKSGQYASDWSQDGRYISFNEDGTRGSWNNFDIYALPVGSDTSPIPIAVTAFNELFATFSPHSRWVAFQSNESGRFEVYVQSFPGPGGKIQISTEGGTNPIWSHDGRELFYRSGAQMMAVNVTSGDAFTADRPRLLFANSSLIGSGGDLRFDVSRDGRRFLMIQATEKGPKTTQFHAVLNWIDEIKKTLPSR